MAFETILNFPAGYALYDETTHMVTPRPGTGRVIVNKDPEDPYYSFLWEPRDGFVPPEEVSAQEPLLLIPGDAQWVHCKKSTTGRIFALKFQSSDRREFFWMQARTDAKDKNPGTLSAEDNRILSSFQRILTEEDDEEEEEDDIEYEPVSPAYAESSNEEENEDTNPSGSGNASSSTNP